MFPCWVAANIHDIIPAAAVVSVLLGAAVPVVSVAVLVAVAVPVAAAGAGVGVGENSCARNAAQKAAKDNGGA
jgi:hypothetical protein